MNDEPITVPSSNWMQNLILMVEGVKEEGRTQGVDVGLGGDRRGSGPTRMKGCLKAGMTLQPLLPGQG